MKLSSLWSEFKAFAFKGNMIELAVAVVIGAAFSTVINSLVNDVIMPTVGYVVTTATTAAVEAKEKVTEVTGIAASQPTTAPTTQLAASVPPGEPSPDEKAAADAEAKAEAKAKAEAEAKAKADAKAKAEADAKASPTSPVKINLMLGPVNAGAFIGALLNFLLVAAAVFFCIVKLLGTVMKKVQKAPAPSEPVTKECPRCLSIIPIKATKCSACTADLPPVG